MRGGPGFGGENPPKNLGGPIKTRLYGRGEEAAWAVKLVKVITGEEPRATPMPDGRFRIRGTADT
jgi:hypothetical protein